MKLSKLNTKRGDDGNTDLFYGGRVPKNSWPVKIGGQISLFNAAIGKCYKHFNIDVPFDTVLLGIISSVQDDLVYLMGEIYTSGDNIQKYINNTSEHISQEKIADLDKLISELGERLDDSGYVVNGWIRYGSEGIVAADLDYCAELCRTIEPIMYDAIEDGMEIRKEILVYINRLSKLFYLIARNTHE